jgi:hypothetical protein
VSNLATFQGDFHKFYAHVARIVELHCEPFLNQQIELGEDHNFTNAQQARVANIVITNTRQIHDKLTLEFFLNGLPKEMFEKVATKPELTKPSAIIDYLKKCDIVARKDGIVPPPAAQQPQPMAAPVDDLNINNTYSQSYAAQARNSSRGNSNSNYRGRGGYNNSSRGQNNARGQTNNYRGQSFRGQNQNYRQNYNTGDRKPLICIYCKKPNHEQEKCFARIRDNQPCLSAKGTPYFPKKLTLHPTLRMRKMFKKLFSLKQNNQPPTIRFFTWSVMNPLIHTSQNLISTIVSLCAISIATIKNVPSLMANYYGDPVRPRVDVKLNKITQSWLYDTGASKSCMNTKAFYVNYSLIRS